MGIFDTFVNMIDSNPTIKVECKYCGELTYVYKREEDHFIYDCISCKKTLVYSQKFPTSFWTLCKPCNQWTGHTKYQISVECLACGEILDTMR